MNGAVDITLHVRIHGRVQGVWYRAWTQQEATKLNLRGWVRNRQDGTVEAVISGPKEQVDAMIRACYQGPPLAKVIEIETASANPPAEKAFETLPTR